MTPWFITRRLSISCLLAVVAALGGAACASDTASGDTDKIQIAISRFDVTVVNAAGRAVVDAKVEILPVGHATSYSARVPRIENGERRSLGFTQFSDSSGITFSPRTARPHAVAVTAKDIEGHELHVEVPWKQ